MKTLLIMLASLGLLLGAQAQQADPASPPGLNVERARINADRARELARYEKEEAVCYQRFAVNDCLRKVRVRRRETLDELRRQEVILNDAERKKRGIEEYKRLEGKASTQAEQDDADRRAAALQEHQERLERAEQKKAERAENERAKSEAGVRTNASAPEAPSSATRAKKKEEFDEKLRNAQERKAQRDKSLAEKAGQPPARPLPAIP